MSAPSHAGIHTPRQTTTGRHCSRQTLLGRHPQPPRQTPPWADTHTPPGQTPPPPRILRDMVNKWAVCILLECILVESVANVTCHKFRTSNFTNHLSIQRRSENKRHTVTFRCLINRNYQHLRRLEILQNLEPEDPALG